jgi:hypothetical protein
MSALRRFLLRCLAFLRREPAERQLERELSAHLGLLEEAFRRQGLSAEASLGICGGISHTVSQKTREIAIRMALGGERRHVRRQVLALTLRLVGAGILLGLLSGFAVAQLIASQLWRTAPHDPLTFATGRSSFLASGSWPVRCPRDAPRASRRQPRSGTSSDHCRSRYQIIPKWPARANPSPS